MKMCRLCGKLIWHFEYNKGCLAFRLTLQPFEVWNVTIPDKTWNEYEHKKCEIKYPEKTLNKREKE